MKSSGVIFYGSLIIIVTGNTYVLIGNPKQDDVWAVAILDLIAAGLMFFSC